MLSEGLTADLVPKLIEGEIDAVLLSLPQSDAALAIAPLFSEPFLPAAPRATTTRTARKASSPK